MGDLDWHTSGSSFKIALHESGYTADLDTDEFWSTDCTNEADGAGYTTGGAALTLAATVVIEDTAVDAWAAQAYVVGDLVRPSAGANGYIYRCIVAGTEASEPTWPTSIGEDIASTATFECVGTSYVRLDAADVSWTPNTTIDLVTQAVIYDTTGGTPGTDDWVVAHIDFDGTEESSNGDFDITFDANGVLQMFISL